MTTPAPATAPDDANKTAIQLTIILVAACLLLNVAFYFLCGLYYDDKRATQGLLSTITDATVNGTRLRFAVFSGLTTGLLVATMFQPRWVSHILSGAIGIASLVAAVFAARGGMPGALTISLVVIGLLYPALVVLSLTRQSRPAWAFLSAMAWVLGVVMLFGAPKIRSQVDISLWIAMIIPGVLVVAGTGLAMVRFDYRDRRA